MALLNIILSTFNGEKYIEEQLDSIKNQKYKDYFVLIRDDGSTDNTAFVISNWIKNNNLDGKFKLIEGENIGFCKSFFYLLRQMPDAKYVAFCDQDDVWLPEKCEEAIHWLQNENDNIPLLFHSGFDFADKSLKNRKRYIYPKMEYHFYNSLTSNIFFGFSITINDILVKELLKVNEEKIRFHDWYAAMIVTAFGKYYKSSKTQALHRIHKKNASPLKFFNKIQQGIDLLKGDSFYTKQAKEFYRIYGNLLLEEKKEIVELFLNYEKSLKKNIAKGFYKKRWNPQMKIEVILRILMLMGII